MNAKLDKLSPKLSNHANPRASLGFMGLHGYVSSTCWNMLNVRNALHVIVSPAVGGRARTRDLGT